MIYHDSYELLDLKKKPVRMMSLFKYAHEEDTWYIFL
jgi:hypothetical protein